MAALFHDSVIDAALGVLNGATNLHICSGAPTDLATTTSQSLATIALQAADFTIGAATPDGRGSTIAAQTGVSVTATGTPASYCLVDGTNLLARTDVDPASPDLTTGSTTDIPAVTFSIGEPATV